jgi:hypothetical protein
MTKEEVIGRLVSGSKQIEGALEAMGAQGTGLHSKALSIEGHLGAALVRKIQYVATIRNKAVHDDAFQDVPFDAWTRAKDQVLRALEAMDPAEPGAVAPVSQTRGRAMGRPAAGNPRLARALGGTVVAIALVVIAVAIMATRRSNELAARRRLSKVGGGAAVAGGGAPSADDDIPAWSLKHPAQAHQAFPWREEQAAFVAAGEKGAPPAETMWEVTSAPRPAHRKGEAVLELDIRLGGGKSRGKVFVKTRSTFGRLETNAHGFEVELAGRKTPAGLTGQLIHGDGTMFDSFTHPFDCRREVPSGCGEWKDNGVGMVVLSTVSYGNALKIIDVR